MIARHPVVESSLRRVGAVWKRRRFWQHTFTLGAMVTLLALLLGVAMARGWLDNSMTAGTLVAFLVLFAMVAWLAVIVRVASKKADRPWLARTMENNQPQLLDRLNTLVFLEKGRIDYVRGRFYHRIARQAGALLGVNNTPRPFRDSRPLIHFGVFVVLLTGTVYFYLHFSPWERMLTFAEERRSRIAAKEKPPEFALPDASAIEQKTDWGEVRITEPGHDLKVTKVDAVQLQIEAAASRSLTNVGWLTTVNEADEKPHVLPPPSEPRYAVYQPVLYMDEMRLTDWDVLTYYAKARTDRGNAYASEVYFLEVRPFREDILKMPGGQGGAGYQCLSQLTELINRQQHIVRQTHRHQQSPPEQAKLREQDRGKIADAESDLGDAARHQYAEMAARMENKPIGDVLNQLALAEKTLQQASSSLRDDQMNAAQNQEREALRQLVATRKNLQKAISEHPDAFEDKEEEPTPVAEKDKLKEIAEFRNESKAAQDFVKQAVEKQADITKRSRRAAGTNLFEFAKEEKDLRKSIENFQAQHPQVFKEVGGECTAAKDGLQKAADLFAQRNHQAKNGAQQAGEKLEQLSQAMADRAAAQQLADAYKLKKLLDEQIGKLEQVEGAAETQKPEELKETAARSKQTTDQLKQLAEQQPSRDSFGPKLRESLSDEKKRAIDQSLDGLARARSAEEQKQKAAESKQQLASVSRAFQESEPRVLQEAKEKDALKEDEQQAFERGMTQLQSLLRQLESQRPLSREDLEKMKDEALQNLQTGTKNFHGSNEKTQAILLLMERELKKKGVELDATALKKLMAELENFSAEVKDPQKKTDDPQVTHIDPSRLPPEYSGRIQKYFKKLSESK